MKRTISLLSMLAFVLTFSGNVFAQNEATVTASATTVTNFTLEASQGPNFGIVETDLTPTPTLAADDIASSTNVADDPSGSPQVALGYAYFTGEGDASVSIRWSPSTVTLDGEGSETGTMDFNPSLYAEQGSNSENGGDGGGSELTNANGSSATIAGDGDITIWIGGTLDNGSSLQAGTYTGDLTIEIDYSL